MQIESNDKIVLADGRKVKFITAPTSSKMPEIKELEYRNLHNQDLTEI
jgi:hypothetical protein